ncbi:MAG: hypothetical protein WA609_02190, partial [Terriglobales bacterium]
AQASTIPVSIAGKGRSKTPLLTKRKIAAQDGVAVSAERLGESNKQWSLAIAARAVRQDQRVPAWIMGLVQPSAYMRINILIEE